MRQLEQETDHPKLAEEALLPQGLGYSALRLVALSTISDGAAIALDELQPLLTAQSVRRQRIASYVTELGESGQVEQLDFDGRPAVTISDEGQAYVEEHIDRLNDARTMVRETRQYQPATYRYLSLIEQNERLPGDWLVKRGSKVIASQFIASALGLASDTAHNRLQEFAQRGLLIYDQRNAKLLTHGREWLAATREAFPEEIARLDNGPVKLQSDEEMQERVRCMTLEIDHIITELYRQHSFIETRFPGAVNLSSLREELLDARVDPDDYSSLSGEELKAGIERLDKKMVSLEEEVNRLTAQKHSLLVA